MGEILEWVRYVLERWMLYLMFSTSLFPLKVWDIHTNRYQGFSRPEVRALFILLIPVGGWFAWVRGETRGEIFVTVIVGCLMMYLIPQFYAEIKHKRMHGVWLSQTPGGSGYPAGGQCGDEGDEGDEEEDPS